MGNNVVAEVDAAGNVKPTKSRSREKIDGVVATVMALGVAIADKRQATSIYEGRGLLTV